MKPKESQASAVAIGNFDGVHLGHQALFKRLDDLARSKGALPRLALTFKPHPQVLLKPDRLPAFILTYEERLERLSAGYVDRVVELPFTREVSEWSPEEFFQNILINQLQAKVVVVGYDFAFGKDRAGKGEALKKLGAKAGVHVEIVEAIEAENMQGHSEVISSSRIRKWLSQSLMEEAGRLLGYPFFYRGVVERGDSRGRGLGFPTANIDAERFVKSRGKLLLPFGVYVTSVKIFRDGAWSSVSFPSVTNLGLRPTISGEGLRGPKGYKETPLLETHLLDFDENLYGCEIEISFLKFLRAEKKFKDLNELKQQIARDILKAGESASFSTSFAP